VLVHYRWVSVAPNREGLVFVVFEKILILSARAT